MKPKLSVLAVLLALSCAVAGTSSIRTVFTKVQGYEFTVIGTADAMSIEKLFPKEAPFYIEFGADSSLVAESSSNGKSYRLEILTFLAPKGAMGAIAFDSGPSAEPVDVGFAGRRTDDAVRFVKGEYLVSVKPAAGGDMAGALDLARAIANRIPRSGFAPELYLPLPIENLVKGSALYFKGPKVFAERFGADLAEALSVGSALEGVAGRYAIDGSEVNLVKLRFPGRTNTMQTVASYIETREGSAINRPNSTRGYYTVYNKDGTEVYIAEFADWLLFIPDAPRGGKAQQIFEYALRGM